MGEWQKANDAANLKTNKEEIDLDEDATTKLLRYARGEVESAEQWAKANKRSAVVFHNKDKGLITFRPKDAYDKLSDNVKTRHRIIKIINPEQVFQDELDLAFDAESNLSEEFKEKATDLFFAAEPQEYLDPQMRRYMRYLQ